MRVTRLLAVALVVVAAGCKSESGSKTEATPPDRATAPRVPPPPGSEGLAGGPAAAATSDKLPGGAGQSADAPPVKTPETIALLGKVDYIELARVLARVGACAGDAPLPTALPEAYAADYCKTLDKAIQTYRKRWLDQATAYFAKLVPAGVPDTVVYPFAGADLVSVLAVFPRANDITTVSLEPAGDPRPITQLEARALQKSLTRVRGYAAKLLRVSHNRTVDMSQAMTWGKLPGHILFTLVGLSIHGYEPISMKFFLVERDGSIRYVPAEEVQDLAKSPDNKKQHVSHMVMPHRLKPWANVEIRFRKQGDDAADVRVYRHIRANLHDDTVKADDRVIKHLESKGRVTAMTKAASYLLWRGSFSRIRNYLLANMEWMVSDATGIPERYAKPAGFEQLTYGNWTEPIDDSNVPPDRVAEMKRFWAKNRVGSVPFIFGYPGGPRGLHLMVTRPRQ